MHMGRGAPAAGSRRHQRRKEAFPAPPTDRRRIFSGRRPRGRNGFRHGVQRETGGRTRKAARPPFRLAASSENSAPRRLAGTEIRVSPPFREADASGSWFPQRRFRKADRQLLHPVRPRGHSAFPGAPGCGGPCLSADRSGNGNAAPRKAARRKKSRRAGVPTAKRWSGCGPCWCTASTKATPRRSFAPGWAARGVIVKERSLAAFERSASGANSVAGAVAGTGGSARPPARTGETKMAERSMKEDEP